MVLDWQADEFGDDLSRENVGREGIGTDTALAAKRRNETTPVDGGKHAGG